METKIKFKIKTECLLLLVLTQCSSSSSAKRIYLTLEWYTGEECTPENALYETDDQLLEGWPKSLDNRKIILNLHESMSITDGYKMHRISCENNDVLKLNRTNKTRDYDGSVEIGKTSQIVKYGECMDALKFMDFLAGNSNYHKNKTRSLQEKYKNEEKYKQYPTLAKITWTGACRNEE
jgi:hypothetical protein